MKHYVVAAFMACLFFTANAHATSDELSSGSVHWYIKAKVITDDIEGLKSAISDLVERTKTEAGAENYEFYLSEDKMLYVFEKYRDSEAGAAHGANVGDTEAMKTIFTMLEPREWVLFGGPYEGPWGEYIKKFGISPEFIGGFNR